MQNGSPEQIVRKLVLVGDNRIMEISVQNQTIGDSEKESFYVTVESWGSEPVTRFGTTSLSDAWEGAFAVVRRFVMGEFDGS